MAANDQKSCFLLKYMAGQLQEVSSVIAHVPTHPAVLSPRYGTNTSVSGTCLHRNTRRGKKPPWVSHPERALKTFSSERVTAVFSRINKQHALGQDHHRMGIACFHFHLHRSAGTCYLQTAARVETIQSTRSTAPCEPAV